MTIPHQLKDLPTDKHGRPVPYVILFDLDGIPNFKINDTAKVNDCLENDKCPICGRKLNGDMWLIGGEMSAFHPNGAYIDPPTHKICGQFALENCPYLSMPNYKASPDPTAAIKNKRLPAATMFYNPTVSLDLLSFFVFVKVKSFSVKRYNVFERFIKAERPYLETEFWRGGKKITIHEAVRHKLEKETF